MQDSASIRTISMIGAGNVAWHLAQNLSEKGYHIRQIWSRNFANAAELAGKMGAEATDRLQSLTGNSDLFIIAVADSVLQDIASQLKIDGKTVVHTAGSMDTTMISEISSSFGVLYPLQTLSKAVPADLSHVPFFVEGSDEHTLKKLMEVAGTLSDRAQVMNSSDRQLIHIAAIFANNYSNHMYTLANQLLSTCNLSFELLEPLIRETTRKALLGDPFSAQTGPARRNDLEVIGKHLKFLAGKPEFAEIYRVLAESIRKEYHP